MHGWGLFFFLLFLLVLIALGAWIGLTQYRARKRGLTPPSWRYYVPFLKDPNAGSATNYPSPRHAGPLEWITEQFNKLRGGGRGRSARGAYEETGGTGAGGASEGLYRGGSRRGRDVEDDAWDTRVGGRDEETYVGGGGAGGYGGYEEQELGLAPPPGYAGAGGAGARAEYASYDDERQEATAGRVGRENPFGDQHEAPSLRSVSPRPEESKAAARGHAKGQDSLGSAGSDGSQTRKSAFREGI